MPNRELISTIASKWWVDMIQNPKFDNGVDSFANILAKNSVKDISAHQLEKFQILVKHLIWRKLNENIITGTEYVLGCDYGPCRELEDIAEQCNIPTTNFPWKTNMWVSDNHIFVSTGYRGPREYLYADINFYKDKVSSVDKAISLLDTRSDDWFELYSKEEYLSDYNKERDTYLSKIKELEDDNQYYYIKEEYRNVQ